MSLNTKNRKISDRVVSAYAKDMLDGKWELTNQGVGFYEDGTLADGQHRLQAVIKSGKAVQMLVTTGMQKSSLLAIDSHRARSASDVLTLGGNVGLVTTNDVAVIRLVTGLNHRLTNHQLEDLADQYIGDIREIGAYFPNSNMRKAVIIAALVMAKNAGVCSDILKKFVNVLVTGICHEHKDQTIIILRDKVIKGEFSKGGSSAREDYLNKIQNSINNYAQGRVMQIVSNTKKLTYPYLPYNK
ncbi:hypothetical protein [Moraxella phage Mcat9]|nr:hypothetical protein [Moraxella phage Mcat9]